MGYGEKMLTLQGTYQVAPNKRLTILAEPQGTHPQMPVLRGDAQALRAACEEGEGRCDVQVQTQHGPMRGTLVEKRPRKFSMWQFEGHLGFLPRDERA